MPKIIIDAGHGGYDNGANYMGRKEKDDNLEQIKKLKELLDLGAITQEEFDEKRKEILSKI